MNRWGKAFYVVVLAAIGVGQSEGAPLTGAKGSQPLRVGSYKKLRSLIKSHQPRYFADYRTSPTAVMMNAPATSANSSAGSSTEFSTTLNQAAGVDEGDKVKNNGTLICQINQDRVLVLRAYPDDQIAVLSTLDFTQESFYPQELYLEGDQLIITGTAFKAPAWSRKLPGPVWYFSTGTVQAKIYDLADPTQPVKKREVEVEGDFVASRKIGSCLYLIARDYPDYYAQATMEATPMSKARLSVPAPRTMIPGYRDSKLGKKARPLKLKRCFYFPGFDDPDFLVVAGLDLSNPHATLDASAFLGAGEQVYASPENLYVTASRSADVYFMGRLELTAAPAFSGGGVGAVSVDGGTAAAAVLGPLPPIPAPEFTERTDIYKITLDKGHSQLLATNTVTGSVLSAYSMDEQDGYFRVVTTEHAWWNTDQQEHNHLSVFDPDFRLAGSLDDFAPGEQIYAARFMSNRAFLVTFKQIDPLFAIDLSEPTQPKVAGQLTLPGYSTFLLPYDETHLIGLGKDVLISNAGIDRQGDVPWWSGQAYYQGMKLAMFDVTDLQNPIQTAAVSIGDRGTDSPALNNPHAILFDRTKNVLAFPINVAQVASPDPNQPWQWGDTIFQGAYIYTISAESGFVFKGAITHKPTGQDPNQTWGDEIERILTIGNDLYTLSDAMLKVNDLDSLSEKGTLGFPQPTPEPYPVIYQPSPLPQPGPATF